LVFIDVILPDELQSFCENGNLRVAVILFRLWRRHLLRKNAGNSAEHDASQQRNNQNPPHVFANLRERYKQSLMSKFWQRPTRGIVLVTTCRMRDPICNLINTRLQPGGQQRLASASRFNGFPTDYKLLKWFRLSSCNSTGLKPRVNERS